MKANPIIKLFEKSGDVGPQPNLLKVLKDKFIKMNWNDFLPLFINPLMSVIVSEAAINCTVVNNMIKFAANGASVLLEHRTIDGRNGLYLVSEMFRLCRKYGSVNDKVIRWRFCLFLNHLLSYMSDGAVLSVELCDVATLLLLERLQDLKREVRAQAAHALHRLQLPDNSKCQIVEKFLIHMTCDPSAEVRTAIVKEIAMFNNVVDEMLKNTIFDNNDNVRKEAYNRFLTYPFLSLSSKQRRTILGIGLEDKNENIKSLVKNQLLKQWVEECDYDFEVFLNKLGLENEHLCEKVLNIIFETYYDSQILDLTNKFLNRDSRMIDFDQLTVENIFLWKCIAKYLTVEKKIALARNESHFDNCFIDILLPDVVKFSDYVREYFITYDSQDDKEFILTQLLDMARTFAIDEVGAMSLNQLCFDLILNNKTSVKPIQPIVALLDLSLKSGKDILNYVKKVINEIQVLTIDVYPIINKIGKKKVLEYQIDSKTKSIDELLQNEPTNEENIKMSIIMLKKIKKEYDEIDTFTEEEVLVDVAVKNLLKGFELVFQVQQLPKVGVEFSLLTDIIQNVIVVYLECSMVSLRMEAIRCITPYTLVNNVVAAKEHMDILCAEISNPLTNKHMLIKIMFDLFLYYDLETFEITDNLDTDEEFEGFFSVNNILLLLANCIDYEVDDMSFKSVVVKGFCDLFIFKKVESIKLISKLLIIWFRRLSRETFNIYNNLVKFFTTYMFYIRSSSSMLAKCYVPILREIEENDLTTKLDIKMDEVNSTLINLSRGVLFNNEKMAVNAHGELAGNILDYLLDTDHSYTAMLVVTLCKLELDFYSDDELINTLGPKLLKIIKHFKNINDKNSIKYLKKIEHKFDPVLQKKSSFVKKSIKNDIDGIGIEKESEEILMDDIQDNMDNIQGSKPFVEVHGDLFLQENIFVDQSTDDESSKDSFTKLDAMKRMSEVFKKSFNAKVLNNSV